MALGEGQARAGGEPRGPDAVSAWARRAPASPRREAVAEAGLARRRGRAGGGGGRAERHDRHPALLRAAAGGAAPPGPPR